MCRRQQKGFTLAEVLASVFLLALGLVGAAGMQLQALRTSQQSAFRTIALSLATEMADTMRMTLSTSSPQALLKPYLQVDFHSGKQPSSSLPNCYSFSCTAEQFVEFNIEQWKRRIATSLPEARAKICFDSQSGGGSTQQLGWTCRPASPFLGQGKGAIVIKIGWDDRARSAAQGKSAEQAGEIPPLLALTVAPLAQ